MIAPPAPAAASSSFYLGMKVLPSAEREAMFAIYDFCRKVDDIADDEQGHRAERAAALDGWRADIDSLYAGGAPGRAARLVSAVERFGCARDDFHAVIDGMALDVERDICCPPMAELDLYCDRVASAVGRLSVCIFGMEHGPGVALSHHLGRALQFTNILRDIDEDAAMGRVYLPREAIEAAGIAPADVRTVIGDPRIDDACRQLAAMAQDHYARADRILAMRPRGHLIAPRLMKAAYGRLLRRMEAAGWAPPRTRIRHNTLVLLATFLWLRLAR